MQHLIDVLSELTFEKHGYTLGYPITIKSLTGKKTKITVQAHNTVLEAMLMIQAAEGIPTNQQRLLFAGRQLDTDKTLSDYNIQRESELHMVLRLRGGMYDISSAKQDLTVCTESDVRYCKEITGMVENAINVREIVRERVAELEERIQNLQKDDTKTD